MKTGVTKKVAVTVAVTVMLLFAAEAGLRVWAYFFRHSYQRYDPKAGMIRLVPDYDAVRRGGRIRVDSKGFRGREFSETKPPGVYRIFSLGDSVTFGLAGEDCHYPVKLERLLNETASGKRFEVINAGVEGYNSRDALQSLEREVLQYNPDMITVFIGWNDLMKHDPGNPNSSERLSRLAYNISDIHLVKFWRKVVFSYLRPMFLRVQTELSEAGVESYEHKVPYVFEDNLERMIAISKQHGIKMVLLTLPSPLDPHMSKQEMKKLYFPYYTYNLKTFFLIYSRYNEVIREVGRKNGVPVLDLSAILKGKSGLFFDTAHMECEGLEVVARELYRFLQQMDIVRSEHRSVGGKT